MPRGGSRPGAGRKPGSKNKRTTQLAAAIRSQLASLPDGYKEPLVIMLEAANTPEPKREDFEDTGAYNKALAAHNAFIMEAAKSAAPYRHARLTASEGEGGGDAQWEDWLLGRKADEKR